MPNFAKLFNASGAGAEALNYAKRSLISGDSAIASQGEAAQRILSLVNGAHESAELELAPKIQKFKSLFSKYSQQQREAFVDQMDKGIAANDPNVFADAAQTSLELESTFNNWVNKGWADPKNRVTNYFPHSFNPEIFAGRGRQKAIDNIINQSLTRGKAMSRSEAEDILRNMTGTRRVPGLELPRTVDLPGWTRDPLAALSQFHGAEIKGRLEREVFGMNDKQLMAMFDEVERQGGDRHLVRDIVEAKLGRAVGHSSTFKESGATPLERGLASFEQSTQLSLASIPNLFQAVNIPLVQRSFGPMAKAIFHTINRYGDAQEFALASSATLYKTLHDIRRVGGLENLTVGSAVLKATGFTKVDEILRIVAANAGRFQAEDALVALQKNPANREAKRALSFLGTDVNRALQTGLTPEDLNRAGRRISESTQFSPSAGSLPLWWRQSPLGRVVTMFKSFAFQQTKFLKDHVLRPALYEGDVRPLIFAGILFPTFGEISKDLSTLARQGDLESRPDEWLDRAVDNMAAVGGLGIFYDVARSLSFGDKSLVWNFVAGPALSDAVGAVVGAADLAFDSKPSVVRRSMRQVVRRIPAVGPRLAQEAFPQKRYMSPLERGELTRAAERLFD